MGILSAIGTVKGLKTVWEKFSGSDNKFFEPLKNVASTVKNKVVQYAGKFVGVEDYSAQVAQSEQADATAQQAELDSQKTDMVYRYSEEELERMNRQNGYGNPGVPDRPVDMPTSTWHGPDSDRPVDIPTSIWPSPGNSPMPPIPINGFINDEDIDMYKESLEDKTPYSMLEDAWNIAAFQAASEKYFADKGESVYESQFLADGTVQQSHRILSPEDLEAIVAIQQQMLENPTAEDMQTIMGKVNERMAEDSEFTRQFDDAWELMREQGKDPVASYQSFMEKVGMQYLGIEGEHTPMNIEGIASRVDAASENTSSIESRVRNDIGRMKDIYNLKNAPQKGEAIFFKDRDPSASPYYYDLPKPEVPGDVLPSNNKPELAPDYRDPSASPDYYFPGIEGHGDTLPNKFMTISPDKEEELRKIIEESVKGSVQNDMGGYKPNGTAADAAYYQSLANKTEEKTDAIMAKINSTLGITTDTSASKQSEGLEQLV